MKLPAWDVAIGKSLALPVAKRIAAGMLQAP